MIPPLRPRRKTSRLPLAVVASLALASAVHAALDATAWKYQQTFELAAPGLVKIPLPAEVLDLARADLADLRVLSPAGDEVPCAIEIPTPPEPVRRAPAFFRVRLQKATTELLLGTGTTAPLDAVHLLTPATSFIKAARVETSPDGEHWETFADGLALVRQPGVDDTTIHLGRTTAAFLRLTLDDDRSAPIPFPSATLILAADPPADRVPVDTTISQRDEFVHETVLTLDLHARHLPLADLEFAIADRLFSRPVTVTLREFHEGELVEHPIASGAVSRVELPSSGRRESLRLPLHVSPDTRQLEVHLANANNAPLAIGAVRAHRHPVWLILHAASPGTYVLLTGNAHASRPAYDLAEFSAEFTRLPGSPVALTTARPNPDYQKKDTLADAPLLAAPLDLAAWKFHRPIAIAVAGAQELELDLAVLAHARSDLGDLRLMRDGHQVPYLLERTSALRPISLAPFREDDPKSPRVSRWKFILPLPGAPLQRLTLNSPTALFSRRLRVYELVPGTTARGEPFEHTLANDANWDSTPAAPRPQFTLPLWTAPQTDTLYVATDNGDNPAIALGLAHADYSVTRLLFRAAPGAVELHYGAPPEISAPRYDLELVARVLLEDEKNTVTLGAESSSATATSSPHWLAGLRGGALLWSALALVVIVLLLVIARLLPKPPASS